jgi:hypothetical protein
MYTKSAILIVIIIVFAGKEKVFTNHQALVNLDLNTRYQVILFLGFILPIPQCHWLL